MKKNIVEYKKKKKSLKKDIAKKSKKAKKKKKKISIKKYNTKKRFVMEDIYNIINKVQLLKKNVTFSVDLIEAPTIENNIKDVNLVYEKKEMKTKVVFTVFSNDIDYSEDDNILSLEIIDDEIPDVDQIFG